ncbi:MAG: response regulator receiver [Rhodospirillaceae bacterium]|nr:MAG: response regulator receiver [Rhodospirillaceae bacterium]
MDLERINILLAEDNMHMATLIRSIVRALGVGRISTVDDGAAAFQYFTRFPDVDIVLTDWNMRPMDSLALVRLVRTDPKSPNRFIPIIMLTGHTELSRVMEARDAGVDEFVAKPFSARSLYTRLEAVVLHRRPFIRMPRYFGPDRRRHALETYTGPERRRTIPQPATPQALSQTELLALLDQQGHTEAGEGDISSPPHA